MGTYEEGKFNASLDKFDPAGWTPLASSIHSASDLLKSQSSKGDKNVVYVVSDGVETCDGDPVEEADKLHDSGLEAIVNIIGFDVDDQGQQQLKNVSDAGGGRYETVTTQQELEDYFEKEKTGSKRNGRDGVTVLPMPWMINGQSTCKKKRLKLPIPWMAPW